MHGRRRRIVQIHISAFIQSWFGNANPGRILGRHSDGACESGKRGTWHVSQRNRTRDRTSRRICRIVCSLFKMRIKNGNQVTHQHLFQFEFARFDQIVPQFRENGIHERFHIALRKLHHWRLRFLAKQIRIRNLRLLAIVRFNARRIWQNRFRRAAIAISFFVLSAVASASATATSASTRTTTRTATRTATGTAT